MKAGVLIGMLCGLVGLLGCASTAPPAREDAALREGPPADSVAGGDSAEAASESSPADTGGLSPASALVVRACDNYLSINPTSAKAPEVMSIKASAFYNNGMSEEARFVYKAIVDVYGESPEVTDAVRMIAQSFYEEKKFDQAQQWYRKLGEMAGEGVGREEAVARVAESIFRMAESYEDQQRYHDAATEYERIALEFPDVEIADAALYNAGLAHEKQAEWSQAILMYRKLSGKYEDSHLLAKARFRTAKCYEKMMQWDNAGEMYLRVVTAHPTTELAPTALYNAGFCFENAGKTAEAAATFEKMAEVYPDADEVADVLFRAGELYGKLKDWESVTRVNRQFSRRFGNDRDRIVQARCMVGVAMYMQGDEDKAIEELEEAISTYKRLRDPSSVNKYYAAKAQFTIGEIFHQRMKAVALRRAASGYRRRVDRKASLLDKAVDSYSRVVNYAISEWTTRAIFHMGRANEDFGIGIRKQDRPGGLSLEEQFSLELGIARALEKYFVENALSYHEQNVKLGIKQGIDDKYVKNSRAKLTSLPFMAGKNYLGLTEILGKAEETASADGFALMTQKLEVLQKIAPFQARAIDLLLICLENGSKYDQTDEFYRQASSLITRTAHGVGTMYADVVSIARTAPIPSDFDPYEQFVYKTKLLGQIKGYEDNALEKYLKAVKIAEAYGIEDTFVEQSRRDIARLLFAQGRCRDVLYLKSFNDPPFPRGVGETEKEEFRAQFQEAGLRFQDQAFQIYRSILAFAEQNYARGKFVTDAYVRLYQEFPEEYGRKKKVIPKSLSSGPRWKCSTDSTEGWVKLDFRDDAWSGAHRAQPDSAVGFTGFPGDAPSPMWYGTGNPEESSRYTPASRLFLRRSFYLKEPPHKALFYLAAAGTIEAYVNEKRLPSDTTVSPGSREARRWDLTGQMRDGENVVCLAVYRNDAVHYGVVPYLELTVTRYEYLPRPPGSEEPMDPEKVKDGVYTFVEIENFEL